MPAPSWENLDDFLDTDDQGGFAIEATITTAAGASIPVKGIFTDPTDDANTGDFEATYSCPHLYCKASDVATVARYDVATIGGVAYDLTDNPKLDGTGWATLLLALQPVGA